jgi:hypothetical protein
MASILKTTLHRRLALCAAMGIACAAWTGSAVAAPACGKAGFWEGEGLQREVEFNNRLLPVMSSYFVIPAQEWSVGNPSRAYQDSGLGQAVCKGNELRLRGGLVRTEYILGRPAAARIELDVIRDECNAKEREITQLPEDKKAEIEERRKQLPHVQRGRRAETPEDYKASQEHTIYRNQVQASHEQQMAPQLSALRNECRAKEKSLIQAEGYALHIQVNPGGNPKRNSDDFHLVADLGDKTLRSGPNDKVRRVLVYITPASGGKLNAARAEADLRFLKTQIDLARLQALIDGGGALPSDAELTSIKAAQQSARAESDKWHRDQDRLVSQASSDRTRQRQAQERDARRAAQGLPPAPAAAPAPARAPAPAPAPRPAQASNAPANSQDTAAAPAPAPATSPDPASPALPGIPQLPGNVGNVLRGVFGR